jgi:hypothetical protein
MTGEKWYEINLEGSVCGLVELLPGHLPGRTEHTARIVGVSDDYHDPETGLNEQHNNIWRMWGDGESLCCLLGYDAVSLVGEAPKFQKNKLPPSSGKAYRRTAQYHNQDYSVKHADY